MSFTRHWRASLAFGKGAKDELSFGESGGKTALDYQCMPLSIAMATTTTVETKPQKMALSDSPLARASAPRDIFPKWSSMAVFLANVA